MVSTVSTAQNLTQLKNTLENAFQAAWIPLKEGSYGRVSTPILRNDLLGWMATQTHSQKFFWQNREATLRVAGLGQLALFSGDSLQEHERILAKVQALSDTGLSFFGGATFSDTHQKDPHSEWAGVPNFMYILPEVDIEKGADGQAVFTAYFKKSGSLDQDLEKFKTVLEKLNDNDLVSQESGADIRQETAQPNYADWGAGIHKIKEAIQNKTLKKCVLARRVKRELTKAPAGPKMVRALQALQANTYTYYLQFNTDMAFLGTSPECLLKVSGQHIETEALAGTQPRGSEKEEDQRLESQLLTQGKEREEHQIVYDYVLDQLQPLCESVLNLGKTKVIKLPHVQHLSCKISGQLHPNTSLFEVVNTLHPTPAMCGQPKAAAKAMIESLEGFKRGWYSGFIGRVSQDEAEFAVAIRCTLLKGKDQYLYSGAGIVAGSDADLEWGEIEQKVKIFG